MTLKLYYDLLSQPSRALYIFLKVCNVPFERNIINLMNLENRTPEYKTINPLLKVPAIEHDDFKLSESIGIIRYISREFKIDDHWYPSASKKQAKVDEYLEWQHLNTRMHCAGYFILTYLNPRIQGSSPDPKKVAVYLRHMETCLDTIENIWLKNKPFLTGHEISVADIIAACELEQPRLAGYDPKKGRPNLTAWLEKVEKETSPHYQDAHKFINLLIKKDNEASQPSNKL